MQVGPLCTHTGPRETLIHLGRTVGAPEVDSRFVGACMGEEGTHLHGDDFRQTV